MWRWLAVFLLGGVLGAAFGVALGFFLFPYIFPPPEAMDQLTKTETSKLIAKGKFIQPNPNDPIHYGKGEVSVYTGTVFLGEDFEVGPGPDFHVYLVPKSEIRSSSRFGRHDVRGSRALARFQGQSEISGSPGRRSHQVPERGDLVPAVLGADLARGSDLRAGFLSRTVA
jgi:hypothetical protein